ncbi:MAG TPA: hypothetical protein VG271_08420, partial [Beijerinckiaceae bacterium]|nr:hypothetical protein [Beijerinckiaceae bacterium]
MNAPISIFLPAQMLAEGFIANARPELFQRGKKRAAIFSNGGACHFIPLIAVRFDVYARQTRSTY